MIDEIATERFFAEFDKHYQEQLAEENWGKIKRYERRQIITKIPEGKILGACNNCNIWTEISLEELIESLGLPTDKLDYDVKPREREFWNSEYYIMPKQENSWLPEWNLSQEDTDRLGLKGVIRGTQWNGIIRQTIPYNKAFGGEYKTSACVVSGSIDIPGKVIDAIIKHSFERNKRVILESVYDVTNPDGWHGSNDISNSYSIVLTPENS